MFFFIYFIFYTILFLCENDPYSSISAICEVYCYHLSSALDRIKNICEIKHLKIQKIIFLVKYICKQTSFLYLKHLQFKWIKYEVREAKNVFIFGIRGMWNITLSLPVYFIWSRRKKPLIQTSRHQKIYVVKKCWENKERWERRNWRAKDPAYWQQWERYVMKICSKQLDGVF